MYRGFLTDLARPFSLTLLIAAVLLLGAGTSAWATPSQSPARQTVPTATPGLPPTPEITPPAESVPGATVRVVSPGIAATVSSGDATVVVPANAMSAPGTLEVAPVAAGQLPAASAGYLLLGNGLDATLYDAQGRQVDLSRLTNPIEIYLEYTADDLAKAGGDPANLIIMYYDESTGKWIALPSTPDPATGRVRAMASEMGTFVLATRSSNPDLLPRTGITSPGQPAQTADTSLVWLAMTIVVLAVAIVLWAFHRRRKPQAE